MKVLSAPLDVLLIITFRFNLPKNTNCKKACDVAEIVGFVYHATRKAMKLAREVL